MSGAEGSVLQQLANVLSDGGVWVFAVGAAVISALIAWVLSRIVRSWPGLMVVLFSATIPVLTLFGAALLFRQEQSGAGLSLLVFVRPEFLFCLAIWFTSGWLAAFAVTTWSGGRRKSFQVEVFE